jgi:hypothetical protein
MKTAFCLAATVTAAILLSGCSSSHGSSVASLSGAGSAPAAGAGYSTSRVAAMHAAAQCIRSHGIPSYQDPVLTADGHVYTDMRSVQNFVQASVGGSRADEAAAMAGIRQACGALMAAAGFQPDDEAPAPAALVQAGVKAAQCLRANGLPSYRDPTSATPFTPGHGFGVSADELPNNGALGKSDPTVQRAFGACRTLLDDEIRASQLTHLAHG